MLCLAVTVFGFRQEPADPVAGNEIGRAARHDADPVVEIDERDAQCDAVGGDVRRHRRHGRPWDVMHANLGHYEKTLT